MPRYTDLHAPRPSSCGNCTRAKASSRARVSTKACGGDGGAGGGLEAALKVAACGCVARRMRLGI
eukprot:363994-Chlamydomonas_euryale.AAC.12